MLLGPQMVGVSEGSPMEGGTELQAGGLVLTLPPSWLALTAELLLSGPSQLPLPSFRYTLL